MRAQFMTIVMASFVVSAPIASAQTGVFTHSYTNTRSSANTRETRITPTNVGKLKLLRELKLDDGDDPRLEAQPLYVPHVSLSTGVIADLAIVATMADYVYAFDVASGKKVWKRPLGVPITPTSKGTTQFGLTKTDIDLYGTNLRWGILSTPVIDPETNTLYVVAWSSTDGSIAEAIYQLFALDVVTGLDVKPPIPVDSGGGPVHFIPHAQKQRSALLLMKAPQSSGPPRKTIIVAAGLVRETQPGHGWVIAFDVESFRRTAAWTTTPAKQGGGIWQANRGPAADDDGFIYLMTGNGSFDGVTDFAESLVRLQYTPPANVATGHGSLKVVDWFTPFVDADRHVGDQDFGSGGAILPKARLVAGAGKDGVLYVVDRAAMGHRHQPLAAVFFTYFPGFAPNPLALHDLDALAAPATHHLHGSPVAWDAAGGTMLFVWGENSALRAWRLHDDGTVTFLAESNETASAFSAHPDAMPGGMTTLSANGGHDGVVWATTPIKSTWNGRHTEADANKELVEGVLRGYDAAAFGPKAANRNPTLKLLWQSTTPGHPQTGETRFTFDKFCPPVVADGKVFVATYDGRVLVYGL